MVILKQLIFGNFGNISGDNQKSQMAFEFLQNDALKIYLNTFLSNVLV
jgi:hypothetical protein